MMKKTLLLFILLTIMLSKIYPQKGVDFKRQIAAGSKMTMNVDSSAKNVFYAYAFPNQLNTSFNFLPEINNVNIQVHFRKTDSIQNYRYTIWEDNRAVVVNKSIDIAQLKDTHADGDEQIFRSLTFGVFPVKNKVITILSYYTEKPLDIRTTIFYGKPIPKPKIEGFYKRFKSGVGVDYSWITDLKDTTKFNLDERDEEITIVKDRSDIDYVYKLIIKDTKKQKIVFESTTWKNGPIGEDFRSLPCVDIDKDVFKKSGDYEIIIEPSINWDKCFDCDMPQKEIDKYTTRHTLSITLEEENYTKKELFLSGFIIALFIGLVFLIILYFNKKQNRKKLAEEQQQKAIAKTHLDSVRSQLNPHFMFNALAGIQSLMNQNKTIEANDYLDKFSSLTRNVLDNKELISLAEEKKLLDDYLQMEQLRFAFAFEIKIADDMDLNTEIPSMLLQPLVENAVKHGIGNKGQYGWVHIGFTKQNKDLILQLSDNGNGFDTNAIYKGLGLRLTRDRIILLNDIYKENDLALNIQSNNEGTKVEITLKEWL